MPSLKFDETDRQKVISEIESHFGVRLSPVGTKRKYLKDQNNRAFWIFGGYEDWHGISAEMMAVEEKHNTGGVLVIAKRARIKIDIYVGPLTPLIKNKTKLSHTKFGEYQFNIHVRGNTLSLKEISDFHLSRLGSTEYSAENRSFDKDVEKAGNIIRKLSPEAKERLLAELVTRSCNKDNHS